MFGDMSMWIFDGIDVKVVELVWLSKSKAKAPRPGGNYLGDFLKLFMAKVGLEPTTCGL